MYFRVEGWGLKSPPKNTILKFNDFHQIGPYYSESGTHLAQETPDINLNTSMMRHVYLTLSYWYLENISWCISDTNNRSVTTIRRKFPAKKQDFEIQWRSADSTVLQWIWPHTAQEKPDSASCLFYFKLLISRRFLFLQISLC